MDYNVLELSPIKKQINVNFTPEEVNKVINKIVSSYKKSASLDGFRKGKVPAAVIEKRFHDQIYDEARQALINENIDELTKELKLEPVAGIHFDGIDKILERDKIYSYSMDFEVLPEFELPEYIGLEVEQENAVVDPAEIDKILRRIRRDKATIEKVESFEPPKDGQIVNIDFEAFDNGKPMKDLSAENYELELGQGQAFPEFEELIKTLSPGSEGAREIPFSEDFPVKAMAGKTLDIHVKVNFISEPKLPELDDEFAKNLNYENLEDLKKQVEKSYLENREKLNKGVAQKKLLDSMLKQTDFPLPPSLVEFEKSFLLADLAAQLELQARQLASLGKSLEELREEMRPQAEAMTRNLVLLLSIAKKEGLETTDLEVSMEIMKNCLRSGRDFRTVREEYERSGMFHQLKEKMTADKAIDFVYEKANVKFAAQPEAPEQQSNSDKNTADTDAQQNLEVQD